MIDIQNSVKCFRLKRASFRNTFLLGRLSYSDEHGEKLDDYFSKLVRKLGVKDGILKTDIIVTPRQY